MSRRLGVIAIVAAVVMRTSTAAAAPPKIGACIDAHAQAQVLKRESRFQEAKQELHECVKDACPAIARKDCAAWLAEIDRDEPTIVVVAKGVQHARVLVDGVVAADSLDGRAIPVDPGRHVIRVESAGADEEIEVLVAAGERNRHVELDLGSSSPPPPPPPPSPRDDATTPRETRRGAPALAWVLGGVSVVALGSFAVFGLVGKSEEGCVPSCSRDEIDDFRRSYLIADVSLGIGLVAAAGALWFALTDR